MNIKEIIPGTKAIYYRVIEPTKQDPKEVTILSEPEIISATEVLCKITGMMMKVNILHLEKKTEAAKEPVNLSARGHLLRPCVVLGMDGTIRKSKKGGKFPADKTDIELTNPQLEEILWGYRKAGFLIFVAYNERDVAKGTKTPQQIVEENKVTNNMFSETPFHLIKTSSFNTEGTVEPYRHKSLTRMPYIGMLAILEDEAFKGGYIVDWDNSIMVGSLPEEKRCAMSANIAFVHIDTFIVNGAPGIN